MLFIWQCDCSIQLWSSCWATIDLSAYFNTSFLFFEVPLAIYCILALIAQFRHSIAEVFPHIIVQALFACYFHSKS
jgi:hypothetical protein